MALSGNVLKNSIESKLSKAGFELSGEHSKLGNLVEAIAEGIVEHIQAAAEVNVLSGSSAGKYKVQ